MASLPALNSSKTTIRPGLLIRAKRGTVTETISDAFTSILARFHRRRAPLSFSSSSHNCPSDALSKIISKITLKDIKRAKQCGGGGFGTVRIYEHPTGRKVALKQLVVSRGQRGEDLRRRTLREGETWQNLDHPSVLPFLGILETPTELYLVSPYVENGALDAYLRRNPDADRRRILTQTASAIAFLHECGIVHGDIKAANILVSDDMRALLCDFGLATSDAGATSVGLQGVGTIRFQSPEILDKGGGKTFGSDVWAFGMAISEILSGNPPFHQHTTNMAVMSAVVLWDQRPPVFPSHSSSGESYELIWSIAQACWQRDATLRPSMQYAYRRLRHGPKLQCHPSPIQCVAFSSDGMTIASGSKDAALRLWDVASGKQRSESMKRHTHWVRCLAFSMDGKSIAFGSIDTTLRVWDVTSENQQGKALNGHTGLVECLAWSRDSQTIVSGSRDHTLRLWDVASGGQRGEVLEGHTDSIWCVAFSPDGKTVASGSGDTTLRLWDVESGKQRSVLQGHTWSVSCLAFSPDGNTIVSGSVDQTLRLWDVASGSQIGESFQGHTRWVRSLAFSSDGATIASVADDRTLRLWDVIFRTHRSEYLEGYTSDALCLAFSPDGKTLASGSDDYTLRLWEVGS